MTAYLVLASPGAQIPDERSVVIADRFAPWALIAPVIWLLFNRLWIEAFAAFLVMEGRNWRAAALQRRGWRLVDVIETDDAEVAFEIHAAQAAADQGSAMPASVKPALPSWKPARQVGRETGSIGLVPVERN